MIVSLITNLEHLDVILASGSPRRFELLRNTGLTFRVVPANVDEKSIRQKTPALFVERAAHLKGMEVAANYPGHLVISADTVVAIDDAILGKPRNETDAINMLTQLSGRTHEVYTGFGLFLLKYDKKFVSVVKTKVKMRELTNEEISEYVNTGEPLDKAGAYAIQGQGAMLVEEIEGSYTNVVGFPVARFYIALDHFLASLTLVENAGNI